MTTQTRTDVHRPSALITEDYEYAYSYDAHPEEGDQRFTWPILQDLNAAGWRFNEVHGGDTCDHCGARLRYVAVLRHIPSHSLIKVGETCLDNRFQLATADFHKLRKTAKLNRERMTLKTKRDEWLTNPDNAAAYEWAKARVEAGDYGYCPNDFEEGFREKFVRTVERYGDASEKFVASTLRDKARTEEREARKTAERANLTSVIAGDAVQITGEITKINIHYSSFHGKDTAREVMTVKDDRGFLVWGTQPKKLYDCKVGDRVQFTAQVQVSDRDDTFGFFKRPKQPVIL